MADVKFHDIGEGMNEGEITNYFVKVGDEVTVDQPLVELQTDKMVAEIPSPAAGRIKAIHYKAGEIVTVGTALIEIDDGFGSGKADSPAIENKQMEQMHAEQTVPAENTGSSTATSIGKYNRILAAPYTRKIARENDVDIERITGTGPGGRVTEEDVHQAINGVSDPVLEQVSEPVDTDTIPYNGIRKQIGDRLTKAITTIPHVTHFDEADLTDLLALRQDLKREGESISAVAFFLKAVTIALKEHQLFNAQLDEENQVIRLSKNYHIGLATNTDRGLVVPVLRDVDKKTIRQINVEMKELTKKAQTGKLSAAEMQHGTFTISNVGPIGGTGATPIINPPQTAIMALHKTKKTPVVMKNDDIAVRQMMTLSLSFDHRVADGVASVEFTNRFIELLQNPNKLILELV
ncbi:dihydrolipoamide acetyltransferase family protein [Virgibacillus siamensis]|uniref:dihydrolipoamide acetyltransferase family protein n=1 Tax=Virgibacillus siamensis TaxID=480071 RepID=UPI000984E6B4|nr:dihydrolipoamide acetyltransferase family protein [Virgibacillus siamensis]